MNIQELNELRIMLLKECAQQECEWIELKLNNGDPNEVGQYISALANSAALYDEPFAYVLWGVQNETHEPVGTNFSLKNTKKGGEELESWLHHMIQPSVEFKIFEWHDDSKLFTLLKIWAASHAPVRFSGNEYIRVGSYTKNLKDYPEKERALWSIFSKTTFEKNFATTALSPDQILNYLDYPDYFELLSQALPDNRSAIFERLISEKILTQEGTKFFITNLGAILFAKNLNLFETLVRKSCRVIVYKDENRINTLREWPTEKIPHKGYANGFEDLINFINSQLPGNEDLSKSLRREVRMYPEIAIRELVANALIHQDFSMTGTGPMVEIFSDRIEITNPGVPLIDTMRFMDAPPQSRNDIMASFMRRVKICEERGSGIDKVVAACEVYQLPAPKFEKSERHTKAILFAPKSLADTNKEDRVRACYLHACLKFVSNDKMTNESLRKRFSIEDKNYPMAWRIIKDTQKAGLVKDVDPDSKSKKDKKYVPFWA